MTSKRLTREEFLAKLRKRTSGVPVNATVLRRSKAVRCDIPVASAIGEEHGKRAPR